MNVRIAFSTVGIAAVLLTAPLPGQTGASTPTVTNAAVVPNPWTQLMTKAAAHAHAHGAPTPLLSPVDHSVVRMKSTPADAPLVPVADLQAKGIRVVPWTTNDPEAMRAVIRTGVDGLISDRPDLLQKVLAEERAARPEDAKLKRFVVSAHRGGRGLRPENTLPSFESGLDQLSTELETDTGVSTDHVSLIWHDQFFNPQACRKADGSEYTIANRIYLRDISSTEAQKTFICDKLHFGADQKNDPSLSPVTVAFSAKEGRPSIYSPTYVAELFRFVRFYVEYYSVGPGKGTPHAEERAANARTVRFNIETKVLPDRLPPAVAGAQDPKVPAEMYKNQTLPPQAFVDALAGIILKERMEGRAAVQSFDFRTLQLIEEQQPKIQTFYLTDNYKLLSSDFVPAGLRLN
ncbi:glycerophosphodiester phosphodiesterase family protein [Terriglobus roseus]|nr:glycerophosphodiester phosphodiesterase family protein [Terriglobus roseus]